MVRSFDYVADEALRAAIERGTGSLETLEMWAEAFESWTAHRFVQSYVAAMDGARILPSNADDIALLLDVAVIQKAAYEVRYEIGHRPDRVSVPLQGLERIVGEHRHHAAGV
jgi:maltose alpha-D-glucosyltransferase/alpha-amylase